MCDDDVLHLLVLIKCCFLKKKKKKSRKLDTILGTEHNINCGIHTFIRWLTHVLHTPHGSRERQSTHPLAHPIHLYSSLATQPRLSSTPSLSLRVFSPTLSLVPPSLLSVLLLVARVPQALLHVHTCTPLRKHVHERQHITCEQAQVFFFSHSRLSMAERINGTMYEHYGCISNVIHAANLHTTHAPYSVHLLLRPLCTLLCFLSFPLPFFFHFFPFYPAFATSPYYSPSCVPLLLSHVHVQNNKLHLHHPTQRTAFTTLHQH